MSIDQTPTADKLDQIYRDSEYKLVCFGHHHVIHHFVSGNRTYFNPGALGCNDKPLARYDIVTLTETARTAELVEMPYDNREFLQSYHRLQVLEREFSQSLPWRAFDIEVGYNRRGRHGMTSRARSTIWIDWKD